MAEAQHSATKSARAASKQEALHALVLQTCESTVVAAGLELIEMRLLRAPRNSFRVQLFVDRPLTDLGVRVDECAQVSRKIGAVLELDDPFPGGWDLEVSSPGMRRRLRGPRDMNEFCGIRARVTVQAEDGRKVTWIGALVAADDETVTLQLENGAQQIVASADIERAELDPTMEQFLALGRQRAQRAAASSTADAADAVRQGVAP